jgi:hypothetical protein
MTERRTPNPELAGHSFRRTLPAHVLRPLPKLEPEVEQAMAAIGAGAAYLAEQRSPPVDPRKITRRDVQDFLLAYCACFLAVAAFIF